MLLLINTPIMSKRLHFQSFLAVSVICITGGLTLKQEHYEARGKNLSKRALQDLMVLSKKEDFPWLNVRTMLRLIRQQVLFT